LAALNSSRFVAFLEGLTGISGLVADPHYRGGGLHQILPGGRLGIHADFNFYPKLKLYRRLNVIVYLNQNWQESYGGHLELWDKATLKSVKRVLPTFNRMVVFDTSSKSLHGHPEPLTCPEGRSRKSLALYYIRRIIHMKTIGSLIALSFTIKTGREFREDGKLI
jgi:Rps23 Pro-64 3,4-dihydroxylase Tpa1-like proline 4-hydroxylase